MSNISEINDSDIGKTYMRILPLTNSMDYMVYQGTEKTGNGMTNKVFFAMTHRGTKLEVDRRTKYSFANNDSTTELIPISDSSQAAQEVFRNPNLAASIKGFYGKGGKYNKSKHRKNKRTKVIRKNRKHKSRKNGRKY